MTLPIERIRRDALAARKARDGVAIGLLTPLAAEAAMLGFNDGKRESTDAETQSVVRKFLKGNTEVLNIRPGDATAQREKTLLETNLPQQLSPEAIEDALRGLAANMGLAPPTAKDTGRLMKALAAQCGGQYAGATAAAVLKRLIGG